MCFFLVLRRNIETRENVIRQCDRLFLSFIAASLPLTDIPPQKEITVAGGHGLGSRANQLSYPWGLYVDDDRIYVADYSNHRIVEWEFGATSGKVVAGGNGQGAQANQLNGPTDVIVNKKTNSLLICDRGNRRVMQWPRQNGTVGKKVISGLNYVGLTMDTDGDLYISDTYQHVVTRGGVNKASRTVVAGANRKGCGKNQLSSPEYVFVDENHSVYVSDWNNHRVMKWAKSAKAGIVVAGGHGPGNALTQLFHPAGVAVDHSGNVYVADCTNNRVMRWSKGATEGSIVADKKMNQLKEPVGLSFDRHGNLYVVDRGYNRVQKFNIEAS